MRSLAFRRALRIAVFAAAAVALATAYLAARAYAGAEVGDGWYIPLFAPGVVGILLVGGVHGDAPPWLLVAAASATTAAAWGLLTFILAYAGLRIARRGTASQP
jgi:hypothetical protein